MKNAVRFLFAVAALMMTMLSACGLDEYYTTIGEKAVAGQPLYEGGEQEPVECNCNCECGGGGTTTDFTGKAFVMDTLVLVDPLGDAAGLVNPFISGEIEKGTINILLDVTSHEVETGAMTVDFGPGSKDGESFSFNDGQSTADATLTAATGAFTFSSPVEKFVLTIPFEGGDPVVIPISSVVLAGKMTATKVTDGTLGGVITMADAQSTSLLGAPLSEQLVNMAGVQPDLDLDEDGTNDAWTVRGTFTAKSCTIAAPAAE